MPVPTSLKRRLLRELPRVVTKATAALTSTDDPLFSVTGGKILLTDLVGEFTVASTGTASVALIQFNPDDSGSTTALTASISIANRAVGILMSMSGQDGDVLQLGVVVEGMEVGLVLPAGDIELNISVTPSGSAFVKWVAKWIAIDDGASVAAV